jgi:hypothetical protein
MVTLCFFQLFGIALIAACFNIMKGAAKRYLMRVFRKARKMFVKKKKKSKISTEIQDKEREQFLNNIKLLQQYVTEVNTKRNKNKKT